MTPAPVPLILRLILGFMLTVFALFGVGALLFSLALLEDEARIIGSCIGAMPLLIVVLAMLARRSKAGVIPLLQFDNRRSLVVLQSQDTEELRAELPYGLFRGFDIYKRVETSSGNTRTRSSTFWDIRLNKTDGMNWPVMTFSHKEQAEAFLKDISGRIDFSAGTDEPGAVHLTAKPRMVREGLNGGHEVLYWRKPFPAAAVLALMFVLMMTVLPWMMAPALFAGFFSCVTGFFALLLGRALARDLFARQIIQVGQGEILCFSSGLLKDYQLRAPLNQIAAVRASYSGPHAYLEFRLTADAERDKISLKKVMRLLEKGGSDPRILCPELSIFDRLWLESRIERRLPRDRRRVA